MGEIKSCLGESVHDKPVHDKSVDDKPVTCIFDVNKAEVVLKVAQEMGLQTRVLAREGEFYPNGSRDNRVVGKGEVYLEIQGTISPKKGLAPFWKRVDKKLAKVKG